MNDFVQELTARVPKLAACANDIRKAFDVLVECYRGGGKVLACGNGGSAADSEHIVGELLKSFRVRRPVPADVADKLPPELAEKLEGALPAVSLVSMSGITTAFANDVAWETAFAQQVLGLGCRGDVLVALSTSGNSANILQAFEVCRDKGVRTIAMTGATGGRMKALADLLINIPSTDTPRIQEAHITVGHIICELVEQAMFGEKE